MTITLSTGQQIEVPDGATIKDFRRYQEAKLRLAAGKKVKATRHNGKPKKSINYAALSL